MKTPAEFCKHPYDSVFKKSESEIIATNIMVILSRTGNQFRELSFKEYKTERLKDGNYSDIEETYFEQVKGYCKSEETAKLFSPAWR